MAETIKYSYNKRWSDATLIHIFSPAHIFSSKDETEDSKKAVQLVKESWQCQTSEEITDVYDRFIAHAMYCGKDPELIIAAIDCNRGANARTKFYVTDDFVRAHIYDKEFEIKDDLEFIPKEPAKKNDKAKKKAADIFRKAADAIKSFGDQEPKVTRKKDDVEKKPEADAAQESEAQVEDAASPESTNPAGPTGTSGQPAAKPKAEPIFDPKAFVKEDGAVGKVYTMGGTGNPVNPAPQPTAEPTKAIRDPNPDLNLDQKIALLKEHFDFIKDAHSVSEEQINSLLWILKSKHIAMEARRMGIKDITKVKFTEVPVAKYATDKERQKQFDFCFEVKTDKADQPMIVLYCSTPEYAEKLNTWTNRQMVFRASAPVTEKKPTNNNKDAKRKQKKNTVPQPA